MPHGDDETGSQDSESFDEVCLTNSCILLVPSLEPSCCKQLGSFGSLIGVSSPHVLM